MGPAGPGRGTGEPPGIPAALMRPPCDFEILIPAKNEARRLPHALHPHDPVPGGISRILVPRGDRQRQRGPDGQPGQTAGHPPRADPPHRLRRARQGRRGAPRSAHLPRPVRRLHGRRSGHPDRDARLHRPAARRAATRQSSAPAGSAAPPWPSRSRAAGSSAARSSGSWHAASCPTSTTPSADASSSPRRRPGGHPRPAGDGVRFRRGTAAGGPGDGREHRGDPGRVVGPGESTLRTLRDGVRAAADVYRLARRSGY